MTELTLLRYKFTKMEYIQWKQKRQKFLPYVTKSVESICCSNLGSLLANGKLYLESFLIVLQVTTTFS